MGVVSYQNHYTCLLHVCLELIIFLLPQPLKCPSLNPVTSHIGDRDQHTCCHDNCIHSQSPLPMLTFEQFCHSLNKRQTLPDLHPFLPFFLFPFIKRLLLANYIIELHSEEICLKLLILLPPSQVLASQVCVAPDG